jgi:putative ABC transport system permease protein
VRLPLTAGRWLAPGDRDAVVLNHVAHAQSPGTRVGDRVTLSLDGAPASLRVVGIVQEIGAPGVAYVTDAAFAAATGTAGRARLLRIATTARTPAARAAAIRDLEEALAAAGVGVEAVIPLAELRTAVGDHILILIRALLALAAILAVVGALGLGSAMSVAVVERTREIGVLKTLGATPARVVRLVVGEGLVVALASFVLAALVSVPLTLLVDALVGSLGFLAPLPLSLSPLAALAWLALVITVAAAATLVPARRAARLGIREALARV